MKVSILSVFIVGSVSALGSGPYLPSGWKPQGPAFLLPTEVEKTLDPIQEAQPSGSDFLREYGPPESLDVFHAVTNQALPDVVTEQAFRVEARAGVQLNLLVETSELKNESANIEVEARQDAEEVVVEDTEGTTAKLEELRTTDSATTESAAVTEKVTEEVIVEVNAEVEDNLQVTEKSVETITESVEIPAIVIPDLLTRIAQDQEDDINKSQDVIEEVTIVEGSGALKIFTEQSADQVAVGFQEYGPPKTSDASDDEDTNEANEVRRRRFSSKYVTVEKH